METVSRSVLSPAPVRCGRGSLLRSSRPWSAPPLMVTTCMSHALVRACINPSKVFHYPERWWVLESADVWGQRARRFYRELERKRSYRNVKDSSVFYKNQSSMRSIPRGLYFRNFRLNHKQDALLSSCSSLTCSTQQALWLWRSWKNILKLGLRSSKHWTWREEALQYAILLSQGPS